MKELHLQIVRALPLFDWTAADRRRAREILLRDVEHPQAFVKAWALDRLATFAEEDPTLVPIVRGLLGTFEHSGKKSLAARAAKIRTRLSRFDSS